MEDELMSEDDQDEGMPPMSPMADPSAPPKEVDPRDRLSQYLKTQIARRQAMDSPEFRQSQRADREGVSDSQGYNNLTSLMMNAAAKFGAAGGVTPKSDFGAFADRANKGLGDYMGQIQQAEQQQGLDQDKRTQLYQHLSDLQRQRQQDNTKQTLAQAKLNASTGPAYQGSPIVNPTTGEVQMFDKKTGKLVNVGQTGIKPEKEEWRESDKVDADGNALVFNPRTNQYKVASGNDISVQPKAKGNSNYDRLPKDQQVMVTDLQKSNASKIAIANQIDSELANFAKFYKSGNKDQAVVAGQNLLKALNSTEGKDAVGAEESKRLAGFLEYHLANVANPGPMFGRDLEAFYKQASSKSNSIKQAVKSNQKVVDDLMSGNYSPNNLQDTPTDIGETNEGKAFGGEADTKVVGGKTYKKVPGGWEPVD